MNTETTIADVMLEPFRGHPVPIEGPGSVIEAETIRAAMMHELSLLTSPDLRERVQRAELYLRLRSDGRWFYKHKELRGEELLDTVAPRSVRRLPPRNYEDLP